MRNGGKLKLWRKNILKICKKAILQLVLLKEYFIFFTKKWGIMFIKEKK